MAESGKLRVMSIAHTAVSRAAGRLRYHPLAEDASLDVHLVVPSRWHQFGRWLKADPANDPGITVHALSIRLPKAGAASWYLHHYRGLSQLADAIKPDVIHLWEEPWSVVALQGARLARQHRAALVLEVDQNIHKRLPPPFEWIRRRTLRHTHLVLARSSDAADVVHASGYAGPTAPIGYGVDQASFHPGIRPEGGPLRLGYVGRIVEEKGLDDVLDAMVAAPASVTLSILGEGPHQAALQARAAAAGLADRVAFKPWAEPTRVAEFLRGLHALVLPTRLTRAVKEQFGRVIIEAQACGTPVIGAATGAIPDVVGPGGWIVPERNPAALARLIAHLDGARDEIEHCGALGLENVAARFSQKAVARDLATGWTAAAARR